MKTYRIWYSKNKACNWLIQETGSKDTIKTNHVKIEVSCQTEESARSGSCPPPFTIVAKGDLTIDGMNATIGLGKEDSCV